MLATIAIRNIDYEIDSVVNIIDRVSKHWTYILQPLCKISNGFFVAVFSL